jgi:hypothetical protein
MLRNVKQFASILSCLLLLFVPIASAQTIQPAPNGTYFQFNTAADTATLTPDQMVGILTGTPTAAAAYTTPTATVLCNVFPIAASGNYNTTFGITLIVKNTSAGANTITMTAGTGITIVGTATVAQNKSAVFYLFPTSCATPAWKLVSVVSGTAF